MQTDAKKKKRSSEEQDKTTVSPCFSSSKAKSIFFSLLHQKQESTWPGCDLLQDKSKKKRKKKHKKHGRKKKKKQQQQPAASQSDSEQNWVDGQSPAPPPPPPKPSLFYRVLQTHRLVNAAAPPSFSLHPLLLFCFLESLFIFPHYFSTWQDWNGLCVFGFWLFLVITAPLIAVPSETQAPL